MDAFGPIQTDINNSNLKCLKTLFFPSSSSAELALRYYF